MRFHSATCKIMSISIHIYIYVYIFIHISVCVYVYIYVYIYTYIYIYRMRSPYGSYGRTPTKHKTSDAPRPKGSQIKFEIFKVSHLTWPDRNGRTGLFTYFLLSVLPFACASKDAAPPDSLTLCIYIYIYVCIYIYIYMYICTYTHTHTHTHTVPRTR
jgi:hypothetical protein